MFGSNQNFYSPKGSPARRTKNENSPLASPQKHPRPISTFHDEKPYTPLMRHEIIGKPIEIIKGKCKLNSDSF